ncbi:MAG: hypothetical protein WKF94_06265 [Solirubrobacteraceae bacterium]
MSAHELKDLLDQVPDTRELVLHRSNSDWELYTAWSDAHEDAEYAYCEWRVHGGGGRYFAYRAAQDREDAAQDALSRG